MVTPLYNSSAYIDATLESLLAQTFGAWESILVDDGSTDDTAARLRRFLDDERFTYLHQANQGIAAARNRAIGAARGDWIAFLDHDDRWQPEKLERQLDAAARNGWKIVCTDATIVREGERTRYSDHLPDETRLALEHPEDDAVDLFALLIRMNFLCASSVLIRRSLFEEHGLLDAAVAPADDYDMWLRCIPHATVGYVPEPLVEYVLHASNHSWKSVEMRMAAIRVLFRTLARCAGDDARTLACEDSLANHYAVLFGELTRDRAYMAVVRPACRLAPHGLRGLRGLRMLRRAWRARHEVRAGF
ncbi:MAG: glycosyltransferase [Actinomycetota bacterium]|nr:glycosyltransferase [Actinomycetota bacterium]